MAVEKVKEYFSKYGIADRIQEFDVSSATVELASQALGCEPCRIAKTLSFMVDGRAVLIVTAGDALYSLAITKFLTNDMGLFPTKQFILDDTPQKYRELIREEFKKLNYDIQAEVEFTTDGKSVHDQIRNIDFNGPALILGSS